MNELSEELVKNHAGSSNVTKHDDDHQNSESKFCTPRLNVEKCVHQFRKCCDILNNKPMGKFQEINELLKNVEEEKKNFKERLIEVRFFLAVHWVICFVNSTNYF